MDTSTSEVDKWSIGTYLRIRPSLEEGVNEIETQIEDVEVQSTGKTRSIVNVVIPPDADPGLVHNNSLTGKLRFEFDNVFDASCSQERVFDAIAKDNVLALLEGVSGTVFAYGQTGSGKTYSIFGGDGGFKERGLIPRSLSLLFQQLKERRAAATASYEWRCQISFTEIYRETVYDLLEPERRDTPLESWPPVQLLEGEDGLVLRNLNVYEVSSEEEALQLFFMGHTARITSSTAMNKASSRSHAVFTILLETEGIRRTRGTRGSRDRYADTVADPDVDPGSRDQTLFTCGKMNMVDLAGSERMYKMENTKSAIKEAKSINLSLHFLEQVIISLREQARQQQQPPSGPQGQVAGAAAAKNTRHGFVPYRNSVLTSLLRDSLGGNCRSSFLLTISPDRQHFEETVATCRFGQRCGEVKLRVFANTEIGLSDQLKELTARVKALERQLSLLEEEKLQLGLELERERELRQQQTEPRTLSAHEKSTCKSSVQELLAAAKQSILLNAAATAARNSGTDSESGEGREEEKESAEEVIEQSHDRLFDTVEQMDKAVLVELSTALGSLVQSMYIEREVLKQQQQAAELKHLRAAQEAQARADEDRRKLEMVRMGDSHKLQGMGIVGIHALPQVMRDMVVKGALFVKHSRMGKKEVRYFHVSEDLAQLCWKPVGVKKKKAGVGAEQTCHPIAHFESVEHSEADAGGCRVLLRGRAASQQKNILLEYAEGDAAAENRKVAKEWAAALRFLVKQSAGDGGGHER